MADVSVSARFGPRKFKLLFFPSFFVFEAYLMLEGSMPVLRHAYRRVEIRTVNTDKNGTGGGNRAMKPR
jgi:hypothetical protein